METPIWQQIINGIKELRNKERRRFFNHHYFIYFYPNGGFYIWFDKYIPVGEMEHLLETGMVKYDGTHKHQGQRMPRYRLTEKAYPEKNNTRYISKLVRISVFERFNHECVTCKSIYNLEIDHVIPWSKGGSNNMSNLQVLCRSCNASKSDKII